ncbi:MAG: chromate transporter [Oscillospiraceae bacterium]|nr:chromate transporter [Oscillospiraceae bacterium]
MNQYLKLFLTFAKVGVTTFGGGYAMLPVFQRELVDHHGWITEGDLNDYFAVAQCTPGVIAVNTATFTGYRVAGNLGGIVATLGLCVPSIAIIVIVAAFLSNFADIPAVGYALAGIRAGVCAIMIPVVIRLARNSIIDWVSGLIFIATVVLAAFVGLSPVIVVIFAGVCGYAVRTLRDRRK